MPSTISDQAITSAESASRSGSRATARRQVSRLIVANRGEIACRIIRSCRAMGVRTIAVFSEPDEHSAHVRLADEAYFIGGAHARDSYLKVDRILAAARAGAADAIHPGYGFLSENPEFAQAVEDAGLTWIGPSPRCIEAMGDKERARQIAHKVGVPVLPGSPRFDQGEAHRALAFSAHVGFPLLVKAAAGGGGIGMRRVERSEDLLEAVKATQSMASKAFGDSTVYLERYVRNARHIEVQVFGDGRGNVVHLYDRECSIQRRFQKIVEEAPAPNLPASTRSALARSALSLAATQKYASAGTVEFVVDADTGEHFFLEMNTRIQVEHPVTEMVTGLDIVAMQIDLARGSLTFPQQEQIRATGHAIECRLYAENPARNFLPSPGQLVAFTTPAESPRLRIETAVRAGDSISMYYDPMIAKVIAHGDDRAQAISTMSSALAQVQVEGISTNLAFLRSILRDEAFAAARVDTNFVPTHLSRLLAG